MDHVDHTVDAGEPRSFDTIAILGLGLMGGSLGLALRHAGIGHAISGYDALPGRAERARALGAVTAVAESPAAAVAGADLVVLAAPVLALRELLRAIAPHLAPRAVVSDLGSTKAAVVRWARETLPDPSRFIACHPMAGKEQSGIEAADADLFAGAVWCLTPDAGAAPDALARLRALVAALGARPLVLDPARHDEAVAGASHLPLLAATALVLAVSAPPDWPDVARLAAGGFRDTTRVASGDPRMARDIALSNREPILRRLDAYIAALQGLRARVAAGDPEIERAFTDAKAARDEWLRTRAGE